MHSFQTLTGGAAPRVKVVDIGANPIDSEPPYAAMLRGGDAEVVGFEPNRAALAELERRRGPLERYFPHAVGDGARHVLHICQAPGMTSLLEPDPAVLSLFHGFPDWGCVLATEAVDTVRLDDVAETAGADLLKLDIQGAELMVLRHAEARLRDAVVIQAEVEFLPLYRGQPLFSEMEIFLRARGFVLHRFFPTVSRVVQPMMVNGDPYAGLGQLVWADAVFIRDLTRIGALSERQLLAMAAILHDAYAAYDIVFRLLEEHDRRTGGSRADAYLAGLQAAPAQAA
ncbi:FkbM family methyltransferase [Roseomonas terrae]|jgi:FkbM family methyltransferase|uniref:FkbM family methyltransferase n=1 Tax=Neoroseomonas terrae TaxID=424799 RepID=A0ABS5ENA0_9PROT|nr:FkbM family methyltransferase [Neoroseomonas terrae]MBR0652493.1 FkbM family methyltransferase [Neoroseomonas terrae]